MGQPEIHAPKVAADPQIDDLPERQKIVVHAAESLMTFGFYCSVVMGDNEYFQTGKGTVQLAWIELGASQREAIRRTLEIQDRLEQSVRSSPLVAHVTAPSESTGGKHGDCAQQHRQMFVNFLHHWRQAGLQGMFSK